MYSLQYKDELGWKIVMHKSCRKFRDLSRMVRFTKNEQVTNSETLKQAAA